MMGIYATLRTSPTACNHRHEMVYITRGASAELIYYLYDKIFDIKDIETVTFTFKQGRTIQAYSTDTVIENDRVTLVDKEHFCYFDGDEIHSAIIFNLDSEETKQFKPGIIVEYEVAIKLNTDRFACLGGKDSIVIEPQHPLAVVDSLYSHI
jgi:hypothetical protein